MLVRSSVCSIETVIRTVFATYGGFNFSYGALYLPQIGMA